MTQKSSSTREFRFFISGSALACESEQADYHDITSSLRTVRIKKIVGFFLGKINLISPIISLAPFKKISTEFHRYFWLTLYWFAISCFWNYLFLNYWLLPFPPPSWPVSSTHLETVPTTVSDLGIIMSCIKSNVEDHRCKWKWTKFEKRLESIESYLMLLAHEWYDKECHRD